MASLQENIREEANEPEQNRTHECGTEAHDGKPLDNRCHQPDHEGVDNKCEEAERHDRNGERQNNEYPPDRRIDKSQDESGHEGGIKIPDLKSRYNIRYDQERERINDPAGEKGE